MLVIKADKTFLKVLEGGVIPSGTVGAEKIKFIFSDEWAQYTKTVHFTGSDKTIIIEGVENDKAFSIPYECLVEPGTLKIALYGIYKDERMPTIYTTVEVRDSGITDGELPSSPTQSVYEQILSMYNDLYNKIYDLYYGYEIPENAKTEIANYANEILTGAQITSKLKFVNCGPTESMLSSYDDEIVSLILPSVGTMDDYDDAEHAIPSAEAVKNYVLKYHNQLSDSVDGLAAQTSEINSGLQAVLDAQEAIIRGDTE
ncbi:MAG: hypothetical protein UHN02_03600 [Acutalibacteraceae bacterium]|nr:hypothetical protein [Acutalibacteraceae bacterium]